MISQRLRIKAVGAAPVFDLALARGAADVGGIDDTCWLAATEMCWAVSPSGAAPASRFWVMPAAEPPTVQILPLPRVVGGSRRWIPRRPCASPATADEWQVLAFRSESPTHVLRDDDVTVPQLAGGDRLGLQTVVRRAGKDDGKGALSFRPIDIGRQSHAIAHGHHEGFSFHLLGGRRHLAAPSAWMARFHSASSI